jgi:hypothetical protein
MVVNPMVLVFALITFQAWWAPAAALVGFVASALTWAGAWWWARRRTVATVAAVRTSLGLSAPGWRAGWPWFLVVGLGGVSGVLPSLVGPAQLPTRHLPLAVAFLGLGLIAPWLRRRRDPGLPGWVTAVIGAWSVVAAALVVVAVPWLGEDGALFAALAWVFLAPFGGLGFALRHRIGGWMERSDAIGRWARAVSPLLPPAQRARALRLEGSAVDALAALGTQPANTPAPVVTADVLDEIATTLAELGDLRAVAVHGWAAHAFPDDPRPFVGLATTLAGHDRALALGYARHAEHCEARGLLGGAGPARALRERLEHG